MATRYPSKTSDSYEMLSAFVERPTTILRMLESFLKQNTNPITRDNGVPCLMSRGATPVHTLLQRCGVVSTGATHLLTGSRGYNPKYMLHFHWPTILRGATAHIQMFPPLSPILWMFLPLIRRRSYLAHDLLERRLLHEIFRFVERDTGERLLVPPRVRVLSTQHAQEEEALLNQCLLRLSRDKDLLRAIRDTWEATFTAFAPRGVRSMYTRLAKTKVFSDGPNSVFHTKASPLLLGNLVINAPASTTLKERAGAALLPNAKTFLHEMQTAKEFEEVMRELNSKKDCAGIFGVASIKIPTEPQRYLAINWEKWGAYRASVGAPFMRELMYREFKADSMPPSGDKCAQRVREYFEANNKMPKPTRVAVPATAGMLEVLSKGLARVLGLRDLGAFTQISTPNLDDKLKRQYRTECTRSGMQAPAMHRASLPVLYSTFTHSDDAGTYDFAVIHTGRYIRFRPLWDFDLPPERHFKPRPGRHKHKPAKLLGGVCKHALQYYYSAEFMQMYTKDTPGYVKNEDLYIALHAFASLTRKEFQRHIDGTLGRRRKRHDAWSEDEDEAILQYYRPKMTSDEKTTLELACASRSAIAIRSRAKVLRARLLARGVFGLEHLPHKNYSAALMREIHAAKEKHNATQD